MQRFHVLALATLSSLGPSFHRDLAAQSLREGYASQTRPLPNGSGQPLLLDDQNAVVYFTGTDLVWDDGASTRRLLTFSAPVFGSFTLRIATDTVLFGENSNGTIWLVPLQGPLPARQLATIPFNYDATRYSLNHVMISAKTGGFSAMFNDIVALDIASGSTDFIAKVPGASGPLAANASGDLFYATASLAFPAPPGSTDVVRFAANKVLAAFGQGPLTIADAQPIALGLDSAGDLEGDGDDDLLLIDWKNGQILEIDDVSGASARQSTLLLYGSGPAPTTLQFVRGFQSALAPSFEPFQPAGGGMLAVHESVFSSTSQLRIVAAARPSLTASPASPIPPGAFTFLASGGPQNGTAILALGLPVTTTEIPVRLNGFEQAIFWNPSLLVPALTFMINFDARGAFTLPATNPGLPMSLRLTAQAAFIKGSVVGSTPPLEIVLR